MGTALQAMMAGEVIATVIVTVTFTIVYGRDCGAIETGTGTGTVTGTETEAGTAVVQALVVGEGAAKVEGSGTLATTCRNLGDPLAHTVIVHGWMGRAGSGSSSPNT